MNLARLQAQGLSEGDLRWLCCKGLLEHAEDASHANGDRRTSRKSPCLQFVAESSFVLTPQGMGLMQHLLTLEAPPSAAGDVFGSRLTSAVTTPCWDQQLRELRVDQILIKRYCVPAENQELILASFQEEEWPARIDDPLPPVAQIDSKRRLHSTIQCLNRNQRAHLLHFRGDGNGSGVQWELRSRRTWSV